MNVFEVRDRMEFQFNWVYDGLYPDDFIILANHIERNARQWLEIMGERRLLYRGVKHVPKFVYAFRSPPREDRRPRDSSDLAHNAMNAMIEAVGAVANRSNSIFTTFDRGAAMTYGTLFAVIPMGEVHYTWSPYMDDWYTSQDEVAKYSFFLRDDVNPVAQRAKAEWERQVEALRNRTQRARNEQRRLVAASIPVDSKEYMNVKYEYESTKERLEHLQSPGGRQQYYRQYGIGYQDDIDATLLVDPNNYDPETLREYIRVDEGIRDAAGLANEVMVKCDNVLYADPYVLSVVLQLIYGETDAASNTFQENIRMVKQMLQQYYGTPPGEFHNRDLEGNQPRVQDRLDKLQEGKFRDAALAGAATIGLAGAMSSHSNIQPRIDAVDMPAQIAQQLDTRVPKWYQPPEEEEEDDWYDDEPVTPEVSEEVQMRFLATAIARKYRINPELSYKIVELAHKHEDEVFPKAIDILAVIAVESSFNPRAVSQLRRDPARGLMQVRPGVWGIKPEALNDIENQIKVGVRILKKYHGRAGDAEGALHAYNVGITSYRRGRTNPRYIARIENAKQFLTTALEKSKTVDM